MNRTLAPATQTIDSVALPEVKQITLDNGVPVYLLNAGDQDVVKVELMFRAGKWYEPKNLISDITTRMLREGTSKHNAKQIADAFDYYGASFNTGAGFETAGASLYSLTKHIDQLIPLAFETFSESIFPENELKTILTNRKQRLTVDLEKNDFVANRNFVNALYGKKHPYGRITEFSDLENISSADLQSYYKTYFSSSNLIIILAGKFGESMVKTINQYFGQKSWAGQTAVATPDNKVEPSSELVHHLEKSD